MVNVMNIDLIFVVVCFTFSVVGTYCLVKSEK